MPDTLLSTEAWRNIRRILAVRLDNIGDLVMLSPALRAMKDNLPEAHITLLTSPAGSQVAPLLPWIDEVMVRRAIWQDVSGEIPINPLRELQFIQELRQREFDAAMIFTSFTQSPYPPAYACYLAGIPIRVGHSKEFGGSLLSHWTKPPPDSGYQVERNLALLESAGFSIADRRMQLCIPEAVQSGADRILEEVGIGQRDGFLLLVPGASCAARRYDPTRFAQAASLLAGQAGLPLVIAGSAKEESLLQPVLELVDGHSLISLVGKTTVPQLAAMVKRASLVLANNSAALHLAETFLRPVVVLYSGTEYVEQWGPVNTRSRLLRREVDCSPCYRFRCPYQMECLDIPPAEVAQAALDVLAEGRPVVPRLMVA